MQKSIGIRITPSTAYFSIVSYENDELEIIVVDKINNPKALNIPEQLKFLRNTLCDIINEFDITNACIRITESNAQSISVPRIYIEGVIQELFASSTIVKYYVGQISNISANLSIERAQFKPYAEGKENFMDIENWGKYSLEERESLMSAISALNI
jgi:retron-type reverse transcriptase